MPQNFVKLSHGATTIDLNDGVDQTLIDFAPVGGDVQTTLARSPLSHGAELAYSRRDLARYTVSWQQKASSHDNLIAKFTEIETLLEAARQNQEYRMRGWQYTPVYLQFKPANATVTAQTEVLYGEWSAAHSAFGQPLRSNYFLDNSLTLYCRPYLDASGLTNVVAATTINNGLGNSITFSGVLGSAPAPTLITLDTFSGGANDRVIVGLRRLGTPANFVAQYQMESATLGTDTALITSATESGFSPGSGNVGLEYTPTGTSEVVIATIAITSNVADQFGAFKAFMRCKGLNNRVIGLRLRAFAQYGSLTKQYGQYTTLSAIRPAALNEIEMVDLTPNAPIRLPVIHNAGAGLVKMGYEVLATATSTGSTPKLRCDYLQLIPVGEGEGGGAIDVSFPVAVNAAGIGSARLDTRDRQALAGLFDGTPTLAYGYSRKAGRGIYAPASGKLFFLLTEGANAVHDYSMTFKAKLDYAARYVSLMGTT